MDDAELVRRLRGAARKVDAVASFLGLAGASLTTLRRFASTAENAADRIEALIAERDAARDAALEEAAKVASARKGNGWEGAPAVHPYDKGYIAACDAVAAAIRALKGKSHE